MDTKSYYKKLNYFFKKNKGGLSAVVTATILILLVVSSGALIWVMINKTVETKLGTAKTCNEIFDKVSLNSRFTCYNLSSNEVQVSINVGDVDELDKIIISVGSDLDTESFTLTNTTKLISGVRNYGSSSEDAVKMPDKNAGNTYIVSGFTEIPTQVQISPSANENICGTADRISLTNC